MAKDEAVKPKKKRKKISTFLRESRSDIKKITWPSFKSVVKNTGMVIAVMIVGAVVISLVDLGLTQLLYLFIR